MLHEIKRTTKNKKSKIVGRGSKRGKTSGRGTKGQKARSGHRIRPHIRDMIKKLPKLRGRGKNSNKAFREKPLAVNLSVLEANFDAGMKVTPQALLTKSLVTRVQGRSPKVKILATGEITKKLIVIGCEVSEKAAEKIAAVGGTVKNHE